MKQNRFLSTVLILCLIFSLAGCRKSESSLSSDGSVAPTTQTTADSMKLLYCYSDTFNPYSAVTAINRNLCRLIFDPLIKVDNDFKPVFYLAASASLDGTTCTVKLKNATFSDGSPLSANDVLYSYNLAKASATIYGTQLYEVQSVKVADSLTVVFNLTRSDPYFFNLLDFPIIKAGSETILDEDSIAFPPVGSGRYIVSEDRTHLIRNDSYYGTKSSVATISLTNAPDSESVSHYVEIGATDIYFTDISDGNIVRMSGKKIDVNLNNFVYIGVNDSYGDLSSKYMRYAISSALDRSKLCQSAYYNNATPAAGFFSPAFKDVSAMQSIKKTSDEEIAIENLTKIGYNSQDDSGYRINTAGKHPVFTLLVNSENQSRLSAAQLIAAQLKNIGIEIKVVSKSYTDYMAALAANDFQLYLGEIRIMNNMDLSGLVIPGGSAAYGVGLAAAAAAANALPPDTAQSEETFTPATVSDIINGFYAGTNTITDVANILQTEMPAIPVCYRSGLLFYNSKINGVTEASQSDIYFSIDTYTVTK